MKIIGLSGKAWAGKDTAADFIIKYMKENHPSTSVGRASFAKKLKETVAFLTNTTYELNNSRAGKEKIAMPFNKTLGRLQQDIGTGLRIQVSDDFWVDALFATDSIYSDDLTIITDVRFPNEKEKIERNHYYGTVIRIERPGYDANDGRNLNHPSETSLDETKFEYVIINNGSLEELEAKLIIVLEKIIE